MAYFVKPTDLDLVFSLCNKSCQDGLCDVACGINFFISLGSKASVLYAIAQELFFMAGGRQAFPRDANCS